MLVEGYKKLFTDLKTPKSNTSKNPFAAAYLTVMNDQAAAVNLGVTPESLSILRSKFILEWFEKYGDKYPCRLFEYQRQLLKDGLFEAYNQWAFGASMGLLQLFKIGRPSTRMNIIVLLIFRKAGYLKYLQGRITGT